MHQFLGSLHKILSYHLLRKISSPFFNTICNIYCSKNTSGIVNFHLQLVICREFGRGDDANAWRKLNKEANKDKKNY